MQLIDAEDGRRLNLSCGVEHINVLVEDVTNRAGIKADLFGDGDKGSARRHRLALNVVHEPDGHVPPFIHVRERLRARGATVTAQIALPQADREDAEYPCRFSRGRCCRRQGTLYSQSEAAPAPCSARHPAFLSMIPSWGDSGNSPGCSHRGTSVLASSRGGDCRLCILRAESNSGYKESRVDFVLKAEQSKSLTEGFRS